LALVHSTAKRARRCDSEIDELLTSSRQARYHAKTRGELTTKAMIHIIPSPINESIWTILSPPSS